MFNKELLTYSLNTASNDTLTKRLNKVNIFSAEQCHGGLQWPFGLLAGLHAEPRLHTNVKYGRSDLLFRRVWATKNAHTLRARITRKNYRRFLSPKNLLQPINVRRHVLQYNCVAICAPCTVVTFHWNRFVEFRTANTNNTNTNSNN